MANTGVIYIAGSGRSGSTLLDALLGRHADCFSAGELINLTRRSWQSEELCACGQAVSQCEFWNAVVTEWGIAPGTTDWNEYVRLQGRFERLRSILEPVLPGSGSRAGFESYQSASVSLIAAIARTAGAGTVIDSSKAPARGIALQKSRELQTALIHLTRDPRGVAWSYMKAFAKDQSSGVQEAIRPRKVVKTAAGWTGLNGMLVLVGRRSPLPAVHLRYEDLVLDPGATFGRLENAVGIDFTDVVTSLDQDHDSAGSHAVAGNRLRMVKTIRLVPDIEWRDRLPSRDRRVVEAVCWPLMGRFGYGNVESVGA